MSKQTTFDYICAAVFVIALATLPFWLRLLAPILIAWGA